MQLRTHSQQVSQPEFELDAIPFKWTHTIIGLHIKYLDTGLDKMESYLVKF